MSCEDIQDLLVEYLLNDLDNEQRASVDAHLANGCSECKTELLVLSESVDVLWQAVPGTVVSQELQHEIVSRARLATPAERLVRFDATSGAATSGATSFPVQFVRNPFAQAFLAFAAGILFMVLTESIGNIDPSPTTENPRTSVAASHINLASPQIPASLHMSAKRYESTQLVALRRRPDSTELPGYVLCDALTREIHVFCYGLQQPPSGTQYVLWLVGTKTETRAAERLEVDADGVCKVAVPWPAGDFRFIKITLEKTSQFNGKSSNNVALTSNAIEPFNH